MTESQCPEQQILEQLLLGHFSSEEAVGLEEHLSGCDLCAARADNLTGEDELIDAMRAKQLPAEEDGRISKLIERLTGVDADGETSRLGDTQTFTGDRSGAELTELHELLDLPEKAGEIGRIGQYRVLDVLGAGGMGLVLRAEDPHLKRIVAIKVAKGDVATDESAKSRFFREAQATAAIEHDNIVTIYQVAEHRGAPYYAMQFLRGESLEDRLKRDGELPQSDVLRIGREIAQGLSAAHAEGLLHRDIKPDNIWLEEKTDRAKIVDFGLARPTDDDQNMTMTGTVLGTPRYMAPEQAQGKSVDARCDLFSLGCVMYHLATGRPPFAGENVVATLMAVVNNQPQPVLEAQPQLDSKLAVVIERLLAKDPAARFQSADEVVEAIRRIEQRLEDQKRRAEEKQRNQPTPAELTLRSQRRRRVTIGTAFVASLLAIAFGVVFVIQTQTGTVRVEVSDDKLEVLIDEEKIAVTDKQWKGRKRTAKHRLAIKLGDQTLNIGESTVFKVDGRDVEHQLMVKLNGFDIASNEFEVVRGDNTVLTITYEKRLAAKPAAMIDSAKPKVGSSGTPDDLAHAPAITADRLLEGHTNPVARVLFTPDGERVVSASNGDHHTIEGRVRYHVAGSDNSVRVWSVESARQIRKFDARGGKRYGSQGIAVSADGRLLALGAGWTTANGPSDPRVHVWDLSTGELRFNVEGPGNMTMRSVAFSADGSRVFVSRSGVVQVRSFPAGELVSDDRLFGKRAEFTRTTWSPDLRHVLGGVGIGFNEAVAWDRTTGEVAKTFTGHSKTPSHVVMSPDGMRVLSCAPDFSVRLWDWESAREVHCVANLDSSVACVAFSPDGQRFLTGADDGSVAVYETATGTELARAEGHTGKVRDVAFSPDGLRAVSGGEDHTVRLWVLSPSSQAPQTPVGAPPLAVAPFEEPEAKAHQQAWADYLGLPVEKEIVVGKDKDGKDVKLTMVLIPPGEFLMGKADVAQAKFTQPFYLGKYEVTQAQWQGVMGSNPSQFQDSPAHPVEQVSWEEIQPFLAKLNEDASADEVNFALPTEAQWEFACRAGTTTSWYCGDSEDDLRQYGWFKANSRRTTYPVGQLSPNALGLYDMHGNVWEWCDGHEGRFRLIRGGSWFDPGIRSAGRIATLGTRHTNNAGFRLAAPIELPEQPAVTAAAEPHQLPADAPTMAIAPFEAEHAKQHQQAWADYLGLPVEKEVELPGGEKMSFMLIPPGEFMMGSTDEDRARWLKKATVEKDKWSIERLSDEGPQHRVRLTRAFYLAAHEVTQGQYQQIMGENPSYFSSSGEGKDAVADQTTHSHPVENVTWRDAVSFCNKLSALEKRRPDYVTSGTSVTLAGGNGYRLPTEAEWEYACRAGGTGAFCFADESKLGNYAWYDVNSAGSTHPVGEKLPNGFGTYDMHGSVWEWCWDWFDEQQYLKRKGGGDVVDPFGPDAGSRRVYRGGFWFFNAGSCRSAIRGHSFPDSRFNYLGLRMAMTIDMAKLKSASPAVADPDRRGAEWVRSINNHSFTYIVIRQEGVERKIGHEELKSDSALPPEPFELTGVFLQYNPELTDAGLVNLRDCRNLTLLNFTFTGIGDAGLIHLQACCPNLQELHLPRGVSDVGLANFKDCRELRRLSLFDVKASTAGLDNFRHCKKLTSLALPGVDLTGDSLESFAGCTVLEHLNLANCRLEAAELAHFKDCTKLKDLELRNNPAITNKGLRYFQNCRELTTLNLARANVDDEGLSFLSDFKRLRSLGVAETNVSAAFLEAFQAKRPNCKISWDGRSSVDQAKLTPTEILTSPDWKWAAPEPIAEVNSEALDAFPTISGDGLTMVFASSREGRQGDGYDLWISERRSATDPWGEPQNLGPQVNSSGFDETPELSHNGLTLIFARSKPGTRSGDLFVTSRSGRGAPWGNAVALEGPSNTSADEQSPSLSEDGLTLMFCSNRPGGIPHRNTPAFAYDLWVSRRDALDAPWKAPTNLGPSINTSNIEKGCCLSSDGLTLLFCNDDLKRTTRSDRYMSHRKSSDEPWSKPVRLPDIFQSDSQDADIELSSDGRQVYVELDSDIYVIRRVPK